jgi:hypothetical protein
MSTPTPGKVTKADIEQKLRNLQGDALGALTIIIAFLLGRRSGKKKNAIVEIRRF